MNSETAQSAFYIELKQLSPHFLFEGGAGMAGWTRPATEHMVREIAGACIGSQGKASTILQFIDELCGDVRGARYHGQRS